MSAKSTPQEWDEVRTAFATSIMVDTAISSLAQNLDGPDWPIKGKDETPAKYIDLNHTEALELLALKNQQPESLDLLVTILRETLSFDDPFGDMVEQTTAASERDNPVLKNLARLGIPENFPIAFTSLSTGTLEFCQLEKLTTLAEFAIFAQNMSQNVIVGGDFRTLLNALSHIDEKAIAQFLPFRPGTHGLHLIEATAQIVRPLPASQREMLVAKHIVPASLREAILARATCLAADKADLERQVAAGAELSRLVQVLNEPAIEPAVTVALEECVPMAGPVSEEPVKSGLFGSLSRWFKK